MQKTTLLVAIMGAMFTLPALAADAPAYIITGNVGFTSDYVFNGISQTFRGPAIQGGFDYVHSSGLFLGTWASNISGNQYTNANMEWDMYGGYNGKINDDLGYSVGLISAFYPDGKTSVAAPNKKWDTSEVNIGATWKGLNIRYTQTITDWYGINTAGFSPLMWTATDTAATGATGASTANSTTADSKGSGYLEANYSYEFSEKLVVSAHVGHQKIKNFDLLSYTDYKIGVTKGVDGFVLGAAYTTTNATDNSLYDVSNTVDKKNLRGGILAVSVTHSF